MNKRVRSHGIVLKKSFGQHFLRDQSVVDCMIDTVELDERTSVFEIGCGDGFLTRSILNEPIQRLWVFEIDPEWVQHVRTKLPDERLTIFHENILDVDFERFKPGPWTVLANLPYQITFPIMKMFQRNRALLREGVVMVQEEVAQKMVAQPGDSTIQSLFYNYYFTMRLLVKIPPAAFYPPPKVYSRLVYFKPRYDQPIIPDETAFWKFIKICFMQRRRMLRNNLAQAHYDISTVDEVLLKKRAQELSFDEFLALAKQVRVFEKES